MGLAHDAPDTARGETAQQPAAKPWRQQNTYAIYCNLKVDQCLAVRKYTCESEHFPLCYPAIFMNVLV